jgi:pimeloyl-ACP methyl ester carboxylesterase
MRRIRGDGITLAVLDEGTGPAVLLIHGFPDSSHVWRHQVPALVGAGLRVIAPDPRGFGESDKPEAVEDYAVSRSRADMIAVLDALGLRRAHVVGHDWGAGVAWMLAALTPDRVERLVVMSVGHPNELREPSIEQRQKHWYQLLFQFSNVAESTSDARRLEALPDSARCRRPRSLPGRSSSAGGTYSGAELVQGRSRTAIGTKTHASLSGGLGTHPGNVELRRRLPG